MGDGKQNADKRISIVSQRSAVVSSRRKAVNAARIVANAPRVAAKYLLVQYHDDGRRLPSRYSLLAVS